MYVVSFPLEVVSTKIKKTTRSSSQKFSPDTNVLGYSTCGESRKNVSIDRERRTEKRGQQRVRKSGGDTRRMRADSAATEGRKLMVGQSPKTFRCSRLWDFHQSVRRTNRDADIYSVDSHVSKFPPANTATSNNSGLPWTNDALFPYLMVDATGTSETNIKRATSCGIKRN